MEKLYPMLFLIFQLELI